jgi:spermidine synthase
MTSIDHQAGRARENGAAPGPSIPWIYVLAVFGGASLTFMVQPMVAKLVLPQLGGSPQVWNTSMVFFQAALLVGYGYAHFLQRIPGLRTQVVIHIAVMLAAGCFLPLRMTELLGEPAAGHPVIWLLGVLGLTIGAPFAALSATAPLVQAWYAKGPGEKDGKEPWALYAASNLGSLLALLAYPVLVEPGLTLAAQRWGWSGAYCVFLLLMAALALRVRQGQPAASEAILRTQAQPVAVVSWRQRAVWIALAAIPSSLMLGVTTHLTTDVASAPFLWVAPLSLYLATFIIAFQTRPLIKPEVSVVFMSTALIVCVATLPFGTGNVTATLLIHLITFFLCALVCHQALVARRPDPSRLTDFYLCMSIGGVVGGAFNALLAPVIFETVLEYSLVLALCALVRPLQLGRPSPIELSATAIAVLGSLIAALALTNEAWRLFGKTGWGAPDDIVKILTSVGVLLVAVATISVRARGYLFFALVVLLSLTARLVGDRVAVYESQRSFFGVVHLSIADVPGLGGPVRVFSHGTTLHGAQATDPRFRCRPLTYYAPETAIGQVFRSRQASQASLQVGAVGLGAGAVAAYNRAGDRMTFFEIDPEVVEISSNPEIFSYTTRCAKGAVDYQLGDARLTLNHQPDGQYDILLIDAFSSDAIPAHLLTVEAVRMYLSKIKPDGIVILHLSNRHLELVFPAASVARAAGGTALFQAYRSEAGKPRYWASSEDVMLVAHSPKSLEAFMRDRRWRAAPPATVKPWSDDYMNLFGALVANIEGRRQRWEAETER